MTAISQFSGGAILLSRHASRSLAGPDRLADFLRPHIGTAAVAVIADRPLSRRPDRDIEVALLLAFRHPTIRAPRRQRRAQRRTS